MTGTSPVMTRRGSRRRRLRLVERRLRARDDRGEGLGLADRQIGHHLAVDVDPGELYAVHELRVGQPVLARSGIDALDPQSAEIALSVAAVAVGIAQPLLDLF